MSTEEGVGNEVLSGVISMLISVVLTYLVSLIIPTADLRWVLTAVAVSTFFSGFFSRHYTR